MTEVTHPPAAASTPQPAAAPPPDEAGAPAAGRDLQPLVHELASLVSAPGLLLAGPDGQVRPGGVTGWYVGDVRLLDTLEVAVAGSGLDLVGADTRGASRQRFTHVARGLGDPLPDPTVRLDRHRELGADTLEEQLVLTSAAQEPVEVVLTVRLGSDLARMAVVKQGRRTEAVAATEVPGAQAGGPGDPGRTLAWRGPEAGVRVSARVAEQPDVPAGDLAADADAGTLTWRVRLVRGQQARLVLRGTAEVDTLFAPGGPPGWGLQVEAADALLRRTVEQGLADLEGLLLRDGDDDFLAAGSPWFLTLFGRDSLWAARMLVPLDAGLALSTLRVLARRQGSRTDPATEEEPGKILHEVRPGVLDLGVQVLPPVYFGSIDATALFVCTLADAHAWGADPEQVAALLPAARGCLEWILATAAETGWLRYVDHTGHGLSNQGWKDSHDSVQHADGRLAEAPIALAEVQAYAHEAAVRGAALLAAYGAPEVPGLVGWADDLRARFTDAFWVGGASDLADGHVAIALDAEGAPAGSLTSNIGHLLGTGVLPAPATRRLGDLLVDPRLDSGFGLRTLASDAPRFSPLSYHGGTVWPHDTAIAVRGLAAEGRHDDAARLAAGVLAAAEGFAHRLPELYGGEGSAEVSAPSSYPAACRPQAWSAAAPIACLVAVTGLRADAAAGVLTHPERTSTRLGAFTLRGLRVGSAGLDVRVEADGAVHVDLPAGSPLQVRVQPTPSR